MDSRSRHRNRPSAAKVYRKLGLEPLGARVVLSAGALGGPLMDRIGPPDVDVRAIPADVSGLGLYSTLRADLANHVDGGRSRELEPFAPSGRFVSLAAGTGRTETWAPTAPWEAQINNVTLSVTNNSAELYLTSFALRPVAVLTIVIGPPVASPLAFPVTYFRETNSPPRDWAPSPLSGNNERLYSLISVQSQERPASMTLQMNDGRPSDSAGLNPFRFAGWLTTAVQASGSTALKVSNSDWNPGVTSHPTHVQGNTALAPHGWESLQGDRENGLIELDATIPKRRSRLLENDDADESAAKRLGEVDLERLMQRAWEEIALAWDAIGDAAASAEDYVPDQQRPTIAVAEQPVIDLAADLIELTVEGRVPEAVTLPQVAERETAEDEKVRIDAGVALYLDFEMATAPEAAPSTVKTGSGESSDAKAASDKKSEPRQPTSAALVGAGLLVSLPFSLPHAQQRDDKQVARQARWHFEQLD